MSSSSVRNYAVLGLLCGLIAAILSPVASSQSLVQLNANLPSSAATVAAVYASAQGAGDLNVVVVGWSDSTATVSSVTDTKGNVYTLAVGPIVVPGAVSQSIYYAKNIAAAAAGANTITVKFSTTASWPDVRILEYSGLDINNPLDGGAGAVGSATTSDSGALSTANSNDLLVGANTVLTSTTAAGSGYTNRIITDPDGDLVEDRVVTATGSYHATATLSSGGSWVMELVAFKAAGAAPSPTAPGNLVASAASMTQINLSWTASTETGGTIASYLVERCLGAGCTNFTQVGTSATTIYSDTGLASGTSYSYRVRAEDTANSVGPYSNTATAITQGTAVPTAPGNLSGIAGASGPVVVVVQGYINATSQPTHTTNAFDSTGGDLLVICVSSHAGVTITPSDSYGNNWVDASGPTSTTVGFDLRTGVWYARNATVGTGHTVTVNLSAAQPVVISVFVVKGSNISAPIDAVSAIGSDGGTQTTSVSSPSITTTNGYDLLIGFAKSSINEVWTAGAGYTEQAAASSAYLNAESGLAVTPGSYAATFGINAAATWQSAVVAVSPSAAAASPSQVNLSWTASTETGGTIASYLVERCQGAGCTGFAQIGSSTNTTYNDTNVVSGASYTYRVRAVDISNATGPYSNSATVTMPGGAIPTAPTNLTPTALSPTQVSLTWGASTETGGTISTYLVERCQGTSCANFAQIGSSANTNFTDSGLTGSTTYSYRVRAVDTANTTGPYSNIASATTPASSAPVITSLSPNSGPVGTSVTITGTNFGSSQVTSTVTFNGVAATPTSWSATSITVPVPTGAPNGNVVVTVGGISSNGLYFTVNPPSITSLNPTSGPVGTAVTIAGTNFGLTVTTGTVTFNGTVATPTMWSNTSVTVPVPSGATTGNVVVTVNGVASNGMPFTVVVPPSITSLSPASGTTGTSVTITGSGFGATQGTSTVTFSNGVTGTPTSWSATAIVVPVPAVQSSRGGASTGPVTVTVGGATSNGLVFTVLPSILTGGVSPTSGPAGTTVTIVGDGFGGSQGSSTVTFNGVPAVPTLWIGSEIMAVVPNGASTGNVVVTVGGVPSNGVPFTVTPVITAISPGFAPVGAPVTITGTGFGATQGSSTVTFNGTTATPTSWSSTSIVVPVPSNPFSGLEPVVVTVGGFSSTSAGVQFSVIPAISALNPASGPFGAPVTITGTSFGTSQGTSTVAFNGVAATPTSWGATSIVVPVPNGATTGNVVVTSAASTSNGFLFTVTAPTAPTNLAATANSSTQIGLMWTASTETGGTVANYLVERCQGAGCTSFAQIGTTATTSYNDTSLTGSTSYSYRVRAQDTLGNNGPYSSTASATTQAPVITAPGTLTATASGPVQINLSWTAATETGGTISSYLVERCQGSGCTNFAQIGTSTTLAFSDTGLTGSTSYSYRVRATDALGNLGPYSLVATATTGVPTFTAPGGLTATAVSTTQINLSWLAATETGGTLSGYLIESCQGAGCTNFTQIGTSATLTFSNTGLTGSTSYSYRVRATDSLGNLGPYSIVATASTPAATPTAPTNVTATAASSTQINLTWTASTEAGGTISNYLIERCQGAACTNFTQIGTSPSSPFSSTGLTGSTTYRFRIRAQDTLNNVGPYSSVVSATTSAPTFTAPTGLTAMAVSAVQINLTWGAATETGGTISKYLIERCQGSGCTTFSQIGTSTTLAFNNTGLTGSTSYTYRVRATDAPGNLGPYSATATATTAAPTITAPSNLTATAVSNSQINLSWTAATETGGTISTYLIERCLGASCTNFAQVNTSTTVSFSDTGLTASTSYSYRVRARDTANNVGPYSSTASATTLSSAPPPPSISLVQLRAGLPSSASQVAVVFASAQGAGDLNVVVVGWSDSTATVSSVTDTKGNVYTLAVGPIVVPGAVSQSIYYAKNIAAAAAAANTVTVKFSTTASYPDVRILEYSGLDINNPLDGGAGAVGSATTSDSGALSTTNSNDLLVGANTVLTSTTAAGSGYTNRIITDPDGDLVEDRVVTTTGSYHATATLSSGGSWVMELVAFKAAGAAPSPTAPGSLVASAASMTQINLSWTASTETGGTIASYLVERCQGAGCTNFAQVGTSATTSYSDTGLASGTSYSYRVRAQDTANSVGPYSNTVTAITQGTAVPTAPGNLSGIAGASGPVVVAVQGYINATSQTTHTTNAFDSTGGDLLVICVSSHAGVTITPSDSYGNSWVDASGPTSTTVGFDLRTGVWYARNATVGTGHTVTVNLSAAQPVVISVFVVKGSNISAPIDAVSAIGSDGGTQTTSVSSPSITTTNGYDLLIGFAKSSINEVWTAGAGYTEQAGASSAYLNAESGLAVTPGSYAATFGINAAATWQSAVVAVSPSAAAASPSQVNLSWTASTETGGTIASYLVERCQGAGCTGFAQIGSSTNTTYNDTNVASGASYTYRVRAVDLSNATGPYSNNATVTMP